ncbi:hypothetical protein HHK36_016312 [Tetracentron sinense]|uniref:Uncharacterized protein n=1 Tax=Tetracentron sinense TaxID=13715 RepID=A0A835DEK8_TETSI|nr:hypothetical protein HHK36_016312 [Tetracentron sinense]
METEEDNQPVKHGGSTIGRRHIIPDRVFGNEKLIKDYFAEDLNDAANITGLSSLQKMTAAIRMLAYGIPADAVDEYVRIGENTSIKSLKRFCLRIITVYEEEYLRLPTEADIWGAPSMFCYCVGADEILEFRRSWIYHVDVHDWHNMIIEDERDDSLDDEYDGIKMRPPVQVSREPTLPFTEFIARHCMIRSSVVYPILRNVLIEHLWSREGEWG